MRKLLFLLVLFLPMLSWGTLATPTAISTTTVASTTVTVNSTAHGQSAGQGGCIVGSSTANNNTCFLIATATTNSFTFTLQPGQNFTACSSSCGNTRPGALIVFGAVAPFCDSLSQCVQVCLWTYTSSGIAHSGATSACPQATAEENAGIASGAVVEVSRTFQMPAIEAISTLFNTFLDYQTSAKNALNGSGFTSAQPGSYQTRRCDTAGCN